RRARVVRMAARRARSGSGVPRDRQHSVPRRRRAGRLVEVRTAGRRLSSTPHVVGPCMSEASDEALVASVVAARDATAFEALVRRHQSRVRNWLRLLTRNSARADDLAQETFIRAWERAHTFSGRGKFVSWLMKVAYNTFLEERRGDRLRTRIAMA